MAVPKEAEKKWVSEGKGGGKERRARIRLNESGEFHLKATEVNTPHEDLVNDTDRKLEGFDRKSATP